METTNPNKVLKRKFDKAIFFSFFAGMLMIIAAVILKSTTGNSQMILALGSVALFLLATVLIFVKSYSTGKKYAVGAKKRRKKYLNVVYGEGSVFSKSSNN